jgi:endonuclease-8
MEGPSIFLAAEQLAPFIGKKILSVEGNTKIGKERLLNQKVLSIFSYGKVLFFQFENFALRIHFLLFGSFEATINKKNVTGDYPRKKRQPRLSMQFKNGDLLMYSCSVKFVEEGNVKNSCDFSNDIMSAEWDGKKALKAMRSLPDKEIADVLLDQKIFNGVGNIIKNETLLLAKTSPLVKVKDLPLKTQKEVVSIVRNYVFQFYFWRKNFVLKKNYQVYRQSYCKICGSKVIRKRTGYWNRISFICPQCQG